MTTLLLIAIGAVGLVAGFAEDNAGLIVAGFYAVLLGLATSLGVAAHLGDELADQLEHQDHVRVGHDRRTP